MATVTGSTGSVTIAAGGAADVINVNLYEWTMNIANEELDATVFATSHQGTNTILGKHKVTGRLRGYFPTLSNFAITDFAGNRASATATFVTDVPGITAQSIPIGVHLNNIDITVNKQTGLNVLDASYVADGEFDTIVTGVVA